MRMPRFRFTMRRMMLAVAVAGFALSAVEMKRRRDDLLDRSSYYETIEEFAKALAVANTESAGMNRWSAKMARDADSIFHPKSFRSPSSRPDDEYVFVPVEPDSEKSDPDRFEKDAMDADRASAVERESAAWYGRMKRKYQRAARYP